MTKAELIASVAKKAEITQKDTEAVVNAFFSTVQETLAKGENVQVIGFGTFEVRDRAALHAALVRLLHLLLHLDGIHPVVRRTRVDLLLGADERAALDTGHVGFMRAGEVALRTLLRFRQKDLLL